VEGFIDRWNTRLTDAAFWQMDTATVFTAILDDARAHLRPFGLEADDEAAFNLFHLVVLNFAYTAVDQPKLRRFMGMRWWRGWRQRKLSAPGSAVAILYPIGAMGWMAMTYPEAPALCVLAYGVANLGYLLLAASVPGSFRILGLTTRWHVVVAGFAALV
jgi:hypothetical protein